eukprot:scaffold47483_cov60-Phaeocystis_antarctica.AAC.1
MRSWPVHPPPRRAYRARQAAPSCRPWRLPASVSTLPRPSAARACRPRSRNGQVSTHHNYR